ncbi:MAG: hypothetical protein OXG33_03185 [Chloroflexi bacterium]|nr:hypothetical protein [Chloroflexota bacterium]
MTVDPTTVPGLLLLAAELAVLAAVGYVVARVVLRQSDDRVALAQGLVVGLALWGVIVNFVMYVVPGLAGAIVGWGITLTLGSVLAWRAPGAIRPRPRVVAGFVVTALALMWAALASRQIMLIPDPPMHLGLAATIRAGGFPPELPWLTGTLARYHHGIDLLVGLLAPPFGPDLAFVSELLGAYAWTTLVLIVTTAMLQRASFLAVIVTVPLMLSGGLLTFTDVELGVLRLPVPAGLPEAGLRASLTDIYWPHVELSAQVFDVLSNIWKPGFPLSYALAFVVLQHAASHERWSWQATLTLAGLVGFLSLLSTTFVPVVLVVWAGLALVYCIQARRAEGMARAAPRLGAGPILAGLLLLFAGGTFTGFLDGAPPSGLGLAWDLEPKHWEALGVFDARPGGLAVLGLGPLALAGLAAALSRRDRVVLALAACAGLLVLVWITLTYPPAPWDIDRMAGHARNLSLVALLLALSSRVADLPPGRWRGAVGALLVGLVIWPTVVTHARSLGLAIANGVQLANARWVQQELIDHGEILPMRRFQLRALTGPVADFIRDHTAVNARVLATEWPYWNVFLGTGRPNNAGFADVIYHQNYYQGAEYWDARHYLEPAAIRRLGLEYILATDIWAAGLPDRAKAWLADPGLFDLLIRDGDESLYRIRPAFLELEVAPHPESFEALRSVPSYTVVYLAPQTLWLERLRVASVLPHARLVGDVSASARQLHLRAPEPWTVAPLGERAPDLIVLPAAVEPWTWAFPPGARQPIWQNHEIAVYAPDGNVAPITPPRVALETPPVTVEIAEAHLDDGRITFSATFREHAPERWTGQDWVIVQVDDGPWAVPTSFQGRGRGPEIAKWFDGLLGSGTATTSHAYELDAQAPSLAVRSDSGALTPLPASEGDLGVGTWVLALRLQHEWQPNVWREAAFIPVLKIEVPVAGEVAFSILDGVRVPTSGPRTPTTP